MDLPHRLQMENEASVSAATSRRASLGCCHMTSNSFAATSGEVEPDYSDASSFCAVGGVVDDTGSIRGGGSGVGIEDYLLSVTARFKQRQLSCRHVSGFRSQLLKMTDNAIRLATAVDRLILRLFYGALFSRSAFARSLMRLLSDDRLNRISGLLDSMNAWQFLRLPCRQQSGPMFSTLA
jgi:hypothetical protein